MDTKHYISAIKQSGMLYGHIVRSTIAQGNVTDISIPKLSDDFLIITSHDVPGSNTIRVFEETLPLLSGEQILYRGQPILAIFGPDNESVILAASQIAISYTASDEAELTSHPVYKEKTLTWGDPDLVFEDAEDILEHTYMTGSQTSVTSSPVGAFAESTESGMEIITSTQWPFHVRNTVSEVCGLTKRKICIHQLPYDPSMGEKLLYPSIYAALSAIAVIKKHRPARMIDTYPIHRPELIIIRRTALDAEKMPIAEIVDVQINQGAVPLFSDELIEQVVAGVTPIYSLKAFQVKTHTLSTPSPPRNFFQGLGFSLGQYSSEAHASNLAVYSNMNPVNWHMRTMVETTIHHRQMIKIRTSFMKDLLEQTVSRSDFSRKFAVYEMQRHRNKHVSTFTGYSRGIGIATGYGINGFSRFFTDEGNYSVTVILDVNDQIRINTSMIHSKATAIWSTIAGTLLGISPDQVTIVDSSTTNPINSGPDILHRDITVISSLIERCCKSIKKQRFKVPLPIVVNRSSKRPQKDLQKVPAKPLFKYTSWGAIAVELEVDPVLLQPVILGVWGTISCGQISDRHALMSTIQEIIRKELSVLIRTETGIISTPAIDIRFVGQEGTRSVNPLPNIVGLLQASYTSALTQALNQSFTSIPAGPQEIFEAIGDHG